MTSYVSPSIALDFTTASLDPRITFTRALNTATVINSSGLIASVNADLPRFDYDPITLACKGLLIEESRTNNITHSENFSNAAWTKVSAIQVDSDVIADPGGSLNGDRLRRTITGFQAIRGSVTYGATTTVTETVFAKKDNVDYLAFTDDATCVLTVSLVNGAITRNTAFSNVSVSSVGNGWYRISYTRSRSSGAQNALYMWPTDVANSAAFGTTVSTASAYVWGAQVEAGAFATSYIPTTTTALTRNADVATITGTNFSSFWQAGRGGVLVRALPSTVSGTSPLVQFDDNTADNIISLRGNTTNPELYIKATTDQATIDAGTIAANTAYRLAGTWATDNCAASLNSGTAVLDSSATIPTVTQARLGSDGTNYLNGHLQSVEYYNERILNSNLQVVSSPAGYRSIIGPVLRDSIIT
jgi:hypothetical protein